MEAGFRYRFPAAEKKGARKMRGIHGRDYQVWPFARQFSAGVIWQEVLPAGPWVLLNC